MGTEDMKARMKLLKFPSSDDSGSFSPTSTPGGSLSARPSRPRPSLGLALDPTTSFSFGGASSSSSPMMSRRRQAPPPGSVNLNGPPLSRERLKFSSAFPPQPSQDEYERKLEEIMKLTGVLTIDGKRFKTPIADLEPLGDLGNGTCGHVVKMRHKESGKIIACKQMRRTGNSEETKRIVMDMDVVLKSHDCREIVVCLGCFITASDVWICMELMATCFDKLLKQLKAPVPENICGKVAVATLNALNYLKDRHGVIHRDVKPSNILLDYEGRVKLCDFGISGRLVDSKAQTRSAGCAAYMAPERINPPNPNKPDYDIRADVWSLGITLVELATGQFPYKDCQTEFEVLTKVIQDDPPCLPQNKGFSIEFRQFVHDCLLKNHKDRPKYKKLLEHPFIIKYRDMDVDVGHWYYRVANHSGDPNKTEAAAGALPPSRKTSLEQRHNDAQQQTFKPQPSPRMVKSWRMQSAGATTVAGTTSSYITSSTTATAADDHYQRTTAKSGAGGGGDNNSATTFSRLTFYTPCGGGGTSVAVAVEDQQQLFSSRSTGPIQQLATSSRSADLGDYAAASHHLADHMSRLGESNPSSAAREHKGLRTGELSSPREHLSKFNDAQIMSRLGDSVNQRDSSWHDPYPSRGGGGTDSTTTASLSQRYERSARHPPDLSPKATFESNSGGGGSSSTLRYFESSRTPSNNMSSSYLDSSRIHMNGASLNRSAGNFMSSYHVTGSSSSASSSYHRSQPNYSRSHHEDYPSSLSPVLKSPPTSRQYDKYGGAYSETSSPRDYHYGSTGGAMRKYSFEGLESGSSSRPDYSSYTPKGTRRYEAMSSPDQQSPRRGTAAADSSRKGEEQQQQQWLEGNTGSNNFRHYLDREGAGSSSSISLMSSYRSNREAAAAGRKYPTEVTTTANMSRGRDPVRDLGGAGGAGGRSSNFLSSLKFPSWTLSSPLSIRKFRTSSSTDRATGFERSVRHQPAYRSLNEKDKQLYSSSGKSDKL